MSSEAQTERAFQKQQGVFLNAKVKAGQPSRKVRKVRNVGLGFKTPAAASKGTYVDNKCPFTGTVSIRGRILKGIVTSTKMKRTIIVRRDYLHYIRKYNRFERRHSKTPAHASPAFLIREGDQVTIGECRTLAKTVRFNVLEVKSVGGAGKIFNNF
ncbi:40S ribosomal protein S11 [Planoprotostelium fungivorum]|uniref:Small ribosomal subunit protein uS17 n=1 Tax=Planoprotostelium fungivorum TaxID=1890364 RepID=A0A2P6NM15_9EUKA|nr:40S ribosomal protein S11 [Planoprotostelium fungivorum]